MKPNDNPNLQPSNPNLPAQPEQPGVEAQPAPAAPEGAPAPAHGDPGAAPATPPVVIPDTPAPTTPPADPASAAAATPHVGPTPAEASDQDVIEKEWVDQADRIVAATKDDPYVEEEAVEALQQDYLKKRYGHDVKKSEGE